MYDRGEVWWGPAPHKSGPSYRPWLIVSDRTHPFSHTECITLAMTTQRHTEGVAVSAEMWVRGGSKREAYVSPWYTATIKHRDLDRQQGELEGRVVDEAAASLYRYTSTGGD